MVAANAPRQNYISFSGRGKIKINGIDMRMIAWVFVLRAYDDIQNDGEKRTRSKGKPRECKYGEKQGAATRPFQASDEF